MIVVAGVVADKIGAVTQTVTVPYNGPGRNFDVRHHCFSASSLEYRSTQGAEVLVDHDHARVIGAVKYLERPHRDGRLHAVCEIDGAGLEGPLYFSPEILHRNGKDIELRRLAVTQKPASVGLGAITAFPFPLDLAAGKIVYQDGPAGELVRRAAAYDRARKRGQPLIVAEPGKPPAPAVATMPAPSGELELRAATKLDISFAKRTIDLVVMPYETETYVAHKGRMIGEIVSRGAFSDIHERGDRVRVNRDHSVERTIGRAIAFHPERPEGLVARLKISATELGKESLALAADGVLDGSAGFRVVSEHWESSDYRRLNRLWLDHIALTPDPAYTTANVLAVRNWRDGPTPNLDKARDLLLTI